MLTMGTASWIEAVFVSHLMFCRFTVIHIVFTILSTTAAASCISWLNRATCTL